MVVLENPLLSMRSSPSDAGSGSRRNPLSPRPESGRRSSRRASRESQSGGPPQPDVLLSVPVSVRGRLGIATTTNLMLTKSSLFYGRYEIGLDTIEDMSSDPDECAVIIKFNFRSKPKVFYLANDNDYNQVDELLATMSDELKLGHATMRAGSAAVEYDRSRSDSLFSVDLEIATVQQQQQRQRFHHPLEDEDLDDHSGCSERAPPWLVASASGVAPPAVVDAAYARVRSGWCCRRFPLEATLFGVLMPLALAGYWLRDTTDIGEETGSVDARGLDRWLPASCNLQQLLAEPRQV